MSSRLEIALRAQLSSSASDLQSQRQRLLRSSPVRQIQNERQALDHLQMRSVRSMRHALELQRVRLEGIRSRVEALNPNAILQRGFAILQRPDGKMIRKAGEVRAGDRVDVRLNDGKLATRVEAVWKNNDQTDSGVS
jgi:exodeoxyribonuclease VII large subunit